MDWAKILVSTWREHGHIPSGSPLLIKRRVSNTLQDKKQNIAIGMVLIALTITWNELILHDSDDVFSSRSPEELYLISQIIPSYIPGDMARSFKAKYDQYHKTKYKAPGSILNPEETEREWERMNKSRKFTAKSPTSSHLPSPSTNDGTSSSGDLESHGQINQRSDNKENSLAKKLKKPGFGSRLPIDPSSTSLDDETLEQFYQEIDRKEKALEKVAKKVQKLRKPSKLSSSTSNTSSRDTQIKKARGNSRNSTKLLNLDQIDREIEKMENARAERLAVDDSLSLSTSGSSSSEESFTEGHHFRKGDRNRSKKRALVARHLRGKTSNSSVTTFQDTSSEVED